MELAFDAMMMPVSHGKWTWYTIGQDDFHSDHVDELAQNCSNSIANTGVTTVLH